MNWLSWFRDRNGPNWPRILLVALGCTVIVALGVVGATSATAFGPYNPSWDGATDLRDQVDEEPGVESEFVSDTSRYQEVDANGTVAFVIAPDEQYENDDIEHVRQFVENGGTLVILENFDDSGNALLRDVGAEARLDGDILRDEKNHYQAPTMPVATGIENHTLTEDVDQLTLNYATAVQPGNSTVLVETSDFAYLVEDADKEIDDDDELAAYPVATAEEVGDGEVIVVGDPSITINVMLEQPDNAAFLNRLYTQGDLVLFDLSHNEDLPPLTNAVLVFRESLLLQVIIGGAGIAGFALLSRYRASPVIRNVVARLPVGRRDQSYTHRQRDPTPLMSSEEQAAYLRQQHPDWNEERVQRVIAVLNRSESKRGNNPNK